MTLLTLFKIVRMLFHLEFIVTDTLVNRMNACFVSISEYLPRLRATHPIFDIKEPVPAKVTIGANDTKLALDNIKVNKATGPDRIIPWELKVLTPSCGTVNCYI